MLPYYVCGEEPVQWSVMEWLGMYVVQQLGM